MSKNAWLTGDDLTGSTFRILEIPGDLTFVMAVSGALLPLTEAYNWEKFGTVEPEDAAYAMRLMFWQFLKSKLVLADSDLTLFTINATVKTGNAMVWTSDATSRFAGWFAQGTPANGDKFAFDRFLAAGNWLYRITYFRNNTNPIINFRVSDAGGLVENVNYDLFGAAQRNTYGQGSFTLTKGGDTEISVEVTGRNASATNWIVPIQSIELWREP